MQFQIIDTEGNALTLREVDSLVAEFFGVETVFSSWACPKGYPRDYSWYDVVGYNIAALPKGRHHWTEVVQKLASVAALASDYEDLMSGMRVFKPFFELCWEFKKKGFIPQSL